MTDRKKAPEIGESRYAERQRSIAYFDSIGNEQNERLLKFFEKIGTIDRNVIAPFLGALKDYYEMSGEFNADTIIGKLKEKLDNADRKSIVKVIAEHFEEHPSIDLDELAGLFQQQFDKKSVDTRSAILDRDVVEKMDTTRRQMLITEFVEQPQITNMDNWEQFYSKLLHFASKQGVAANSEVLENVRDLFERTDKRIDAENGKLEDKQKIYKKLVKLFLEKNSWVDVGKLKGFFFESVVVAPSNSEAVSGSVVTPGESEELPEQSEAEQVSHEVETQPASEVTAPEQGETESVPGEAEVQPTSETPVSESVAEPEENVEILSSEDTAQESEKKEVENSKENRAQAIERFMQLPEVVNMDDWNGQFYGAVYYYAEEQGLSDEKNDAINSLNKTFEKIDTRVANESKTKEEKQKLYQKLMRLFLEKNEWVDIQYVTDYVTSSGTESVEPSEQITEKVFVGEEPTEIGNEIKTNDAAKVIDNENLNENRQQAIADFVALPGITRLDDWGIFTSEMYNLAFEENTFMEHSEAINRLTKSFKIIEDKGKQLSKSDAEVREKNIDIIKKFLEINDWVHIEKIAPHFVVPLQDIITKRPKASAEMFAEYSDDKKLAKEMKDKAAQLTVRWMVLSEKLSEVPTAFIDSLPLVKELGKLPNDVQSVRTFFSQLSREGESKMMASIATNKQNSEAQKEIRQHVAEQIMATIVKLEDEFAQLEKKLQAEEKRKNSFVSKAASFFTNIFRPKRQEATE